MNQLTPFIASFLVLAIGGLINASYLTVKHYQKKPLVCPINHDCSTVTESKWSHIFYIRNEFLGILFFLSILASILITIFSTSTIFISTISYFTPILTGIGLLFSSFLLLIQAFAIKKYCFYCILSAIITLLLFLNSLALYR